MMLGCGFLHCSAAAIRALHSRDPGESRLGTGAAQGNTPLTVLGAREIPVIQAVELPLLVPKSGTLWIITL